jgi:glutaredoxin
MKLVRRLLGRLILLFDFLFHPKARKRAPHEQEMVDQQTKQLALYQFKACPFCVKVRRAMKRQNLTIELRDAKNVATHRDSLLQQGGKVKVPCLRIQDNQEVTWLYESNDIIAYLNKRFD